MIDGIAPAIEVGIVKTERIQFNLKGRYTIRGKEETWSGDAEAFLKNGSIAIVQNGNSYEAGKLVVLDPLDPPTGRFVIRDVVIGIGFHWEQKEIQEFQGALKLMIAGDRIQVVNKIPVENYLISVISSEMSGDCEPALLKAHTIISRSWLLAQIEKKDVLVDQDTQYATVHESEEEYIRWYDREDHEQFHVCADDHCQRYQGIARAHNPELVKAIQETSGEVLVFENKICDARFSKCCGGVVEQFEHCWEPVPHAYLQRVEDNPHWARTNMTDLKIETNAVQFIKDSPEAFCNTSDTTLLRQVLNDYDQASKDFYRWKVSYTQEEISQLIRKNSGIDFGEIIDLIPVERGESARLIKLKIIGSKKTLTIGKELEIRRWLSDSHLYSSAFFVERQHINDEIPGQFILHGAGWGHGVGLCQIGAAIMGSKGYTHEEILSHYFIGASIEKRYD